MTPGDRSPEAVRRGSRKPPLKRAELRIAELERDLAGRNRRVGELERQLAEANAKVDELRRIVKRASADVNLERMKRLRAERKKT